MKGMKLIGVLFISIGLWVLFYKESGFHGFGGYVDKSWENILISLILTVAGIFFIKSNKTNRR
ncbi:cadmium resistance protein CadD (predicted permease) [Aureibacter tunicatorum]|uniref:Cadmium resistance protein CadD (Predicted permease) n=1 Tax=Aureibacter tunicatorum TaxID=866807 RepID=A0AAE3XRC1_9BACT|nr:cadmium resistance protein CadD (predicted permease) [Aureibacter tunicatorum]BDD03967.1 hypothetical protein AUTU_14500 [Aureibacter tunicatorum]